MCIVDKRLKGKEMFVSKGYIILQRQALEWLTEGE
jgi:hypothetical protein